MKYAIAIGVDTQEANDVLAKFTGNPETVLKVYTAEALRKVIRVIAITASKVKSSTSQMSATSGAPVSQEQQAIAAVEKDLADVDGVEW